MIKKTVMENSTAYHTREKLRDAPLLKFELKEVIDEIKEEDIWKMGEINTVILLKSSYMRIVLIALHEQSEITFHQSSNLISLQLIEGKLDFQTEKQSVILQQGSLLTLHEDCKHTLVAIKESVFLLTIIICGDNPEEIA
jgi:quercetin dioxygenase-like cupin family protein